MKKTIWMIALGLLLAANSFAADKVTEYQGSEPKDKVTTSWSSEKGYLEVTTRNNTFRVFPCGELRKLTWEKLNPNEDAPVFTTISTSGRSISGTYVYY